MKNVSATRKNIIEPWTREHDNVILIPFVATFLSGVGHECEFRSLMSGRSVRFTEIYSYVIENDIRPSFGLIKKLHARLRVVG